MKYLLKKLIGLERYGLMKFRYNPATRRPWGGPLNGQRWRVQLVSELIRVCDPKAIIETGTFLGSSTEWLSAFQIPIWTCEGSVENYGYAKQRLRGIPNVTIEQSDSRAALRHWLNADLSSMKSEPLLIYLDAHWDNDLPLREEIDIVFQSCPRAVILVDDFQVPDDDGYGFDDYGDGKALTGNYIKKSIIDYDLSVFYPQKSACEETGSRRGCVVLCSKEMIGYVQDVKLLRLKSSQ